MSNIFDSSLAGMGGRPAMDGRSVVGRHQRAWCIVAKAGRPPGTDRRSRGLLSDMVHRICIDGRRVWCGTNKGVGGSCLTCVCGRWSRWIIFSRVRSDQ